MGVTREDILKIAKLAKLELSEEEVEKYARQLDVIVEYVAKLQELDVEGVEPLTHVHDLKNVTRPDDARPSLPREEVLKNAPEEERGYFAVPKVVTEK